MEDNKVHPLTSKTLWTSLAFAIAAFSPSVDAFIKNNPQTAIFALSTVFGLLRLVTKGRISIS